MKHKFMISTKRIHLLSLKMELIDRCSTTLLSLVVPSIWRSVAISRFQLLMFLISRLLVADLMRLKMWPLQNNTIQQVTFSMNLSNLQSSTTPTSSAACSTFTQDTALFRVELPSAWWATISDTGRSGVSSLTANLVIKLSRVNSTHQSDLSATHRLARSLEKLCLSKLVWMAMTGLKPTEPTRTTSSPSWSRILRIRAPHQADPRFTLRVRISQTYLMTLRNIMPDSSLKAKTWNLRLSLLNGWMTQCSKLFLLAAGQQAQRWICNWLGTESTMIALASPLLSIRSLQWSRDRGRLMEQVETSSLKGSVSDQKRKLSAD